VEAVVVAVPLDVQTQPPAVAVERECVNIFLRTP
jgi:hypothetical protein